MFSKNMWICLSLGLAVSACTVSPSVKYGLINKPEDLKDKDFFDSYFLQGSKIHIAKTAGKDDGSYEIISIPIESARKLGLAHDDPIGITTNINIVKLPNLELVSEIGDSVTDKRIEYIKEAAGVIKTLLPLAGFSTPTEELDANNNLPYDFTLLIDPSEIKVDKREAFPIVKKNGVIVQIGALPPDAVELKALFYHPMIRLRRATLSIQHVVV